MKRTVPAAFMDRAIAVSGNLSWEGWRGVIDGIAAADYLDRLESLSVPTLVIWGDQDFLDLAVQQTIVSTIPGARLVRYEGIGHAPNWEVPERVARDVSQFVDRAMTADG